MLVSNVKSSFFIVFFKKLFVHCILSVWFFCYSASFGYPNWFWYKRKLCWKTYWQKIVKVAFINTGSLQHLNQVTYDMMVLHYFSCHYCLMFFNEFSLLLCTLCVLSMHTYLTLQERDPLGVWLLFKCRKRWAKNDIKKISDTVVKSEKMYQLFFN